LVTCRLTKDKNINAGPQKTGYGNKTEWRDNIVFKVIRTEDIETHFIKQVRMYYESGTVDRIASRLHIHCTVYTASAVTRWQHFSA